MSLCGDCGARLKVSGGHLLRCRRCYVRSLDIAFWLDWGRERGWEGPVNEVALRLEYARTSRNPVKRLAWFAEALGRERAQRRLDARSPGMLTVAEWALGRGVALVTARQWIRRGLVPYTWAARQWIRADEPAPVFERGRPRKGHAL